MSVPRKQVIDLKLDSFISAIREKKCTSSGPKKEEKKTPTRKTAESRYENRLQAQKEIMLEQKKLILKQEQTIRQLHFEKLNLENEVSQLKNRSSPRETSAMVEDVRRMSDQIAIAQFNTRPQVKEPKVVQRMKQRDEERRRRWQEFQKAKEARIQERKEALLKEAEENRRKAAEQKRLKMKEERDRRQAEEEAQTRKLELRKCGKTLGDSLLIYSSFSKWKRCVAISKWKQTAVSRILFNLEMRTTLRQWKNASASSLERKLIWADKFYTCLLVRSYFLYWRQVTTDHQLRIYAAVYTFNGIIARGCLQKWHLYCLKLQVKREQNYLECQQIYERILMKKYLLKWKEYPALMNRIRQREKRIRDWEMTVRRFLPDFHTSE